MSTSSITAKRGGLILRIVVNQLQPELYEYRMFHGAEELDSDAGFTSIGAALRASAEITGDVLGFEVAYGGIIVGTYPINTVFVSHEAIASLAIETASALGD